MKRNGKKKILIQNPILTSSFFVHARLLIMLISCLVACGVRIVVNGQTDTQTKKRPHCTGVQRVN